MADSSAEIPTIKRRWLIAVYAIVPIIATIVLLDMLVLGQALQPYLTAQALYFPLFLLLFELPHIIASLTTFADKEYLRFYLRHILTVLPIKFLIFAVVFWYSTTYALILFGIYTMYHTIRQQTGIALTMTKRRDTMHEVWTWLGVLSSALGYLIILSPALQLQPTTLMQMHIAFGIVVIPFILASLAMVVRTQAGQARWYVAAVSTSALLSFFLIRLDYLFLAVFVLRFVHDITAFLVYTQHDRSRQQRGGNNIIYRSVAKFGLPTLIATPLIAIVAAYLIRVETAVLPVSFLIIMLLSVAHYSLEGVMWKRSSIHRAQLRFE